MTARTFRPYAALPDGPRLVYEQLRSRCLWDGIEAVNRLYNRHAPAAAIAGAEKQRDQLCAAWQAEADRLREDGYRV